MHEFSFFIKKIFEAETTSLVCHLVNAAILDIKEKGHFDEIYDCYQNVIIADPEDINTYFLEMKDEELDNGYEEGAMKEFYGLFSAAYDQLLHLNKKDK